MRSNRTASHSKAVKQVGLIHSLACMLIARQFKSHVAWINNHLAFIEHLIGGTSLVNRKVNLHVTVWRLNLLCTCHKHGKKSNYCDRYL